jgi:hypothetical protein
MKIEDKLMQKHLSSMLRLENMRKEKETENTSENRNRPKLSNRTIEITKDSRSLYDRQKDLTRKKKINDEINRKTMEDNEMKEFTGAPKINQRSIEMPRSNISQLDKPIKQYHRLMQAHRTKSSSKRSSYDGRPPLQQKHNSRPSVKTSRKGPEQLHIFNPIEPFRDITPRSVVEPPLALETCLKKIQHASRFSFSSPKGILTNSNTPRSKKSANKNISKEGSDK